MEASFKTKVEDKEKKYLEFIRQFKGLIEGENEEISVLANTCAALREAFGFFWIGFYLVRNEQLILGPFQGSVACYRIAKGRGVCGTAWATAQTQVVPDVEAFPGHIACSSESRSEIVVPLITNRKVHAVLDIDSNELATFDQVDKNYLEEIARILSKILYE
ncbi:MAG: GAF domain-containing protein [Paraprevotella sp.]|nr:GAF domain-containing protein [Paraprevotella sp.]